MSKGRTRMSPRYTPAGRLERPLPATPAPANLARRGPASIPGPEKRWVPGSRRTQSERAPDAHAATRTQPRIAGVTRLMPGAIAAKTPENVVWLPPSPFR